jgi:hypothetical protein
VKNFIVTKAVAATVKSAFGVDRDFALDPDLIFQFPVGLEDGGIEAPFSVHDYFFEDVDAAGRTGSGVAVHDALCCLLKLPVGQIPAILDTTVDTKALKLLKPKVMAERVGFEPTRRKTHRLTTPAIGGWNRRTNSVQPASSCESRQNDTNACADSFRGSIREVGG